MHDCEYNKMRVLADLARIRGFVVKHGVKEAKGKHKNCKKQWEKMAKDLEKHIEMLKNGVSM